MPSLLTSPADATEMPLPSPGASPLSLKPLLPLSVESSMTAGNCAMWYSPIF